MNKNVLLLYFLFILLTFISISYSTYEITKLARIWDYDGNYEQYECIVLIANVTDELPILLGPTKLDQTRNGGNYNPYDSYYRPETKYLKIQCRVELANYNVSINNPIFTSINHLQQLSLTNSVLENIDNTIFTNLENLHELDLSYNNINYLEDGIFVNLINLRVLHLEENQLNLIKNITFLGLNKLKWLYLSSNNISVLQKNTFGILKHLEILHISNNPLKSVDLLLHLSEFSAHNIGINKIEKNQDLIKFLGNEKINISLYTKQLKVLDLSLNNITNINVCFSEHFSSLKSLNLSSNRIQFINISEFNSLESLNTLDLSKNKLKNLPSGSFYNLGLLKVLNISVNMITKIQYGLLDELKQLEILDLSHNSITEFHFKSDTIKTIFLNENKLSDLETSRWKMVKQISLDNNLWSCKSLHAIIDNLNKMKTEVISGTSHHVENIGKIACDNSQFIKIINNNTTSINFANVEKNIDQLFKKLTDKVDKSNFVEFLNNDFKNSSFFNFIKKFKIDSKAISIDTTKIESSIEHAFAKVDANFMKSKFVNFFNFFFTQTVFYKFFKNFTIPDQNLTSENYKNDFFEQLANVPSDHLIRNEHNNIPHWFFFFSVFLLFSILLVMLYNAFGGYVKYNIIKCNSHVKKSESQIQLDSVNSPMIC